MKSTTLALLALASAAIAQEETQAEEFADYLQQICFPFDNATGIPYWDAPCNAAQNILLECTYGPGYNFSDSSTTDTEPAQLSNSTQQACICMSQFWTEQQGCQDCYTDHGDTDFAEGVTGPVYTSLSSSYCAAKTTPTLAFADWLMDAGESVLSTISAPGTTATSYSDPIGSKTAVSLYFTPSVTGTAAYEAPAQATGTSINTVSGQIVPLAANGEGSLTGQTVATSTSASGASGASPAATTTTTGGAVAGTPHAMAAAVGVMGIAGLAALL